MRTARDRAARPDGAPAPRGPLLPRAAARDSSGAGALTVCALASGTDVFTQTHLELLTVAGRLLTYEWESVKWRADLRRLSERLRDPERTDALTGLLNRVAFVEAAEREWRLAERGTLETYVLACRITNLRQISERHGAAVGELLMKDAADVMQTAIRRTDHAGRLADDVYGAVLVGCKGLDGAAAFIGRYGQALQRVTHERPAQLEIAVRDVLARGRRVARGGARPGRDRGQERDDAGGRGGRVSAEAGTATPPPPKGVDPAHRARRPLGLPQRRDRGAGLRHLGRGRGRGARGAQRQHGRAGAGGGGRDQRGAARARDRGALRDRLHRSGELRGGLERGGDDQAVGRQALPGGAGRVRGRRAARGDGRPGRRARRERHRRDDEARGAAGGGAAPCAGRAARSPAAPGRGRRGRGRVGGAATVKAGVVLGGVLAGGRGRRRPGGTGAAVRRGRAVERSATPTRPSACAPSWWSCAASWWARRPSS